MPTIGSHPISFKLLNQDGNSVLGIFDGQGQTSRLDITNTSRLDWLLKELPLKVATAENYHFELKFRPGTLNLNSKTPITVDEGVAGWKISGPKKTEDGVSFYLLSTKPFALKQQTTTFLTLNHLNADGSGGARGTRVELKWETGLQYANSSTVPAGHRVQHLSVVNERGEKQIPLVVSFVGTDKIFNEGEFRNTLKLHITNRLKEGIIDLYPQGDAEHAESKFTFSFDASDNDPSNEWVLAPMQKTKDIKISAEYKVAGKPTIKFIPHTDGQSLSPSFSITPSQHISLEANKFIDVVLSDIVTPNPSGKTNLYFHYENIPGYQDGEFVYVIEKSPVVYKKENVGIGTTEPKERLHVKSKMLVEGESLVKGKLSVDSEASVKGKLFVDGEATITKKVGIGESTTFTPDKALHVKGWGDQEIMIESEGGGGIKWSLQSSAGLSSGRFEIINRTTDKNHFTILRDGNVGIGTLDPKEKLHVDGNLRINNGHEVFFADNGQIRSADNNHRILFRRDEQKLELREHGSIIFSPGSENGAETAKTVMLGNGNVGIGTPSPQRHLHVKGTGDQEIMIESEGGNGVAWTLQSGASGPFEIINRTTGKSHFTILKDDGVTGINTTDPKKTLHVNGGLRVENEVSVGGGYDFEVDAPGVHGGRFKVNKDGCVGIGTHNPTKAKLEVSGWIGTVIEGFGFLNRNGASSTSKRESNNYSIWASDRMCANEFQALSDVRMKNVQGRSDSATDLRTLLGIEITDYRYKDVIGKGNGASKKVIGQQIEKVFPQAVSKSTEAVPDIYQQASIRDGWVALPTDLKTGERVKLITVQGEGVHEVLEVMPDKFRVSLHDEEKVFVFGREVDDFITVDYDAIAMLNVSATQQLKKELDHEVKTLRAENAQLRAANDALAKRLQLLESRLDAAVGVVSAG